MREERRERGAGRQERREERGERRGGVWCLGLVVSSLM